MALEDTHPDADLLKAFAEGRLSHDETERVAEHIESCDLCAAKVDEATQSVGDFVRQIGSSIALAQSRKTLPAASQPELLDSDFQNQFELKEVIGSGGSGVVYRAWQPALQRHVAVKQLHAGSARPSAPGLRGEDTRFRREIEVLGRVTHPNLVKIHSSGVTADGDLFYVMDLIEGDDLSTLQQLPEDSSDKLPDWKQPVSVVRQIASAAQSLHDAGVVHRDIKPGNIRIGTDGTQATLMDLGAAGLLDDDKTELTRDGSVPGTLPYVSPEQFHGAQPAPADDVYNLGAILWELLAGRQLFNIDDQAADAALIKHILSIEPVDVRLLNPDVSADLSAVVRKCLEKDRRDRYSSARELICDLDRILSGEPVTARRSSVVSRCCRRLLRRRKAFVATLLAFLAAQTLILPVVNRLALVSVRVSQPVPVVSFSGTETGPQPIRVRNVSVGDRLFDASFTYNQNAVSYPMRMGAIVEEEADEALTKVVAALNAHAERPDVRTLIYLLPIDAPNAPPEHFQHIGIIEFDGVSWQSRLERRNLRPEPRIRPDVGFIQFMSAQPETTFDESSTATDAGLRLITVERTTSSGATIASGASVEATCNGQGLESPFPALPAAHSGAVEDGYLTSDSTSASLYYDFGEPHAVSQLRLWNYHGGQYGVNGNDNSVGEVTIYGSTDPDAFGKEEHSSWKKLHRFYALRGNSRPGRPDGESRTLNSPPVQVIRLHLKTSHDGPAVGIAEVQFVESVP